VSMRSICVIALALVCGVSAAFGIRQLRGAAAPSSSTEMAQVVVAKKDIPRGQMLRAEMLTTRPCPKDWVPAKALRRIEDALERSALTLIGAGETVSESKIAPKDAGRGLAALIPSGMRAYTVKTSRVASNVAGFVLPGNRVDVLLTLRGNSEDGTGGGSTTTLLQAVEILAVDQQLDAPAENKTDPKQSSSVTLLVTPDQAALLDLGQNMGTLTLSLRSPGDTAAALTSPATLNLLRFAQKGPTDVQHQAAASVPGRSRSGEEDDSEPALKIRTLRGSHAGHVKVSSGR
jgi:pilus assembly protein CpaB